MVERDVVLAKVAAIERCLKRISQVRSGERRRVLLPVDVEDIVAVNLQRAAQAAIDLALHVAASEGYGLPDDLAEGFILLEKNGVIDSDLCGKLRRMVGFRNIAVHQYEILDPAIVEAIASTHVNDLQRFAARIVEFFEVRPA
jgi:uncharacterized protein YutE (UPF0331/DUF86 family)